MTARLWAQGGDLTFAYGYAQWDDEPEIGFDPLTGSAVLLPRHVRSAGSILAGSTTLLPRIITGLSDTYTGSTLVLAAPPAPEVFLEWSFDDGTFGPFTQQSGNTWTVVDVDGNHVLEGSTGSNHRSRYTPETYGGTGETLWISGRVRVQGTGTLLPGLDFGGIQPVIDRRNGTSINNRSFQIRSGGTNFGEGDGSPTIVTGEWYTIVARWLIGSDVSAWLYDEAGQELGHAVANTSRSSSGGRVGFVSYGNANQFDDFVLANYSLRL